MTEEENILLVPDDWLDGWMVEKNGDDKRNNIPAYN